MKEHWHITCARNIMMLNPEYGLRVLSARKQHCRKIAPGDLPDYVKDFLCIGEHPPYMTGIDDKYIESLELGEHTGLLKRTKHGKLFYGLLIVVDKPPKIRYPKHVNLSGRWMARSFCI